MYVRRVLPLMSAGAGLALFTVAFAVYAPWSGFTPMKTPPQIDVHEYEPAACLVGEDVWIAYNEADDTSSEWIWSLRYRRCSAEMVIEDEGFILPQGVNADSPSISSDGASIWVTYLLHGEGGDSISYSYWDSSWSESIVIPTSLDLARVSSPSIAYIPSMGEVWLVYVGEAQVGRGRRATALRDLCLKRGTPSGGGILWGDGPDLVLTDQHDEWDPCISAVGEGAMLAWASRSGDDFRVMSAVLIETGLLEQVEVTPFWGRDPRLVASSGDVWVYYEPYWFGITAKYLGDDGWSNPVWVADDVEKVRNPSPVAQGLLTTLIAETYDPGLGPRLGFAQAVTQSLYQYETETEVMIDSAEYHLAKRRLTVVARCTEPLLDIAVWGWESVGNTWVFLGMMDNNKDGTYLYDGYSESYQWIRASTMGSAPAQYIRRCSSGKGKPGK